jgi:hypothetical protein
MSSAKLYQNSTVILVQIIEYNHDKNKRQSAKNKRQSARCHVTLGKFIKAISIDAGLSQLYTNHCIRASCITALDDGGMEARHIMNVSGRKSETSINSYSTNVTFFVALSLGRCQKLSLFPLSLDMYFSSGSTGHFASPEANKCRFSHEQCKIVSKFYCKICSFYPKNLSQTILFLKLTKFKKSTRLNV